MTCGRRIAVSALTLLVLSTPMAWAQRPAPAQVAVGGLRPTRKPNYQETALEKLPEAQELREVIDVVVRDIIGRPVLNHAALRAALGSSYLVTVFECSGKPGCIVRAFSGIKGRAKLVVYGDYSATRKRYLVRLRMVDLESSQMVAEHEFSIEGDGRDRERWKKELTTLFEPIQLEREEGDAGGEDKKPTGGEVKKPTGGEVKKPTGGEEEKPAGGEEEKTAEDTTTGNLDELTDADFGVETTNAAVRPVEQRRTPYWLQLRAEAGVWWRRFDFDAVPGAGDSRPDGFKGNGTPTVSGALEVYPLARAGDSVLGSVGFFASYARSTATETGATSALAERVHLGASYRLLIGTSDTLPTFRVAAGYLHNGIEVRDRLVMLPDVSYRAATFGADVTVPIATPRVALRAGARYLVIANAGNITTAARYGESHTAGIELEGGVDLRLRELLFISIGAAYGRFVYEFEGTGVLSGPGAVGARDRVTMGTVATGVLF